MSHFQSALGVLSSPSFSPAFLKCFQKKKKKKANAILRLKQPLQLQPWLQVAHCFGRSTIHKGFFSQGKSQIYPGLLLNRKWKPWGCHRAGQGGRRPLAEQIPVGSIQGCSQKGELGSGCLESWRSEPKAEGAEMCILPSPQKYPTMGNASPHPTPALNGCLSLDLVWCFVLFWMFIETLIRKVTIFKDRGNTVSLDLKRPEKQPPQGFFYIFAVLFSLFSLF